MQENRIRFNTFEGKDGREWINMIIISDDHVFQFFSETRNFPIPVYEFIGCDWEIETYAVQFRNAYVSLVAEGKRVALFCKIII